MHFIGILIWISILCRESFEERVGAQYFLDMELRPATKDLQMGDSVTIVCSVGKKGNSSDVDMAWIKKTGSRETAIGRADNLVDEYKNKKRYEASRDIVKAFTKYKFTLTIKNLQSTDSGEIGCQIPSHNIEIFRPLLVHVPVKSVHLTSKYLNNTSAFLYTENQLVEFVEGETRQFSCDVEGSYPEPKVRMLIGDADITERFNRTLSLEGENGGGELFYKVRLWSASFNVTYDFSEKELQCIAEMENARQRTMKSTIRIGLKKYRPKFICPTEVFADLYQSDLVIKCTVLGQPEVVSGRFHWKRQSKRNDSIDAGRNDGVYQGILESKSDHDNLSKEMSLKINRIFPQHFRDYYFEARNSEGSTIHKVELKRSLHSMARSEATGMLVKETIPLFLFLFVSFCKL